MYSADDLIGAVEMSPEEAAYAYGRLTLTKTEFNDAQSVSDFSRVYGFMPMMVARHVADYRRNDSSLNTLISTNEFLIKNFGKKRLSHEFVEGTLRKSDKFWRSNDPLGVYQPGDMFYVDDNHPWRDYFPLLILVPTACALMLFGVALLIRTVVR